MTTATQTKSKPKNSESDNSPWTEKATSAAHNAVDQVAGRAAKTESNLRQKAEESSATIAEKRGQLEESINTNYANLRAMASENPLATAGIAFATGIALTMLLRRRR